MTVGNRLVIVFFSRKFRFGKTVRFNSGNPYTDYDLGFLSIWIYQRYVPNKNWPLILPFGIFRKRHK